MKNFLTEVKKLKLQYIFLENRFKDNCYYHAINADELVQMDESSTYDKYGQGIDPYDTGDSIIINSTKAKEVVNRYLKKKKENLRVETEDYISAYEHEKLYQNIETILKRECTEEIDYYYEKTQVIGFNYWDGNNYRSIIAYHPFYDTKYVIVEDIELTKELNNARENCKYGNEGGGYKYYIYGKWRIIISQWQGDWESFIISKISKEEN